MRRNVRRSATVLALAGLALLGPFTLASSAQDVELCEVTVHDHTPGVYPGGLHIHNTCT